MCRVTLKGYRHTGRIMIDQPLQLVAHHAGGSITNHAKCDYLDEINGLLVRVLMAQHLRPISEVYFRVYYYTQRRTTRYWSKRVWSDLGPVNERGNLTR